MALALRQAYRPVTMVGEPDADPLVTFDWTTFASPSTAVVAAVAEEADRDPATIEPLYEAVDPDALDTLVASTRYPKGAPNARIEFLYQGYRILVKANGHGYIYDQDGSRRSTAEPRQLDAHKQTD